MNDGLAALWATVAHVARARVEVLEVAVQALRTDAPDRAERCAVASEECHKLVGSLDSYGVTGGSALALRAAGLFELPAPPLPELDEIVGRLRRLVEAPTLSADR